jgi:hypothetical protein
VIALLFVLMVLALVVKFWYLAVAALVLYALLRLVVGPWREARAKDAHERLRHARARREIDDITFAAARAMYAAAARSSGEVIDGTAVEEWRG